MCLFCKIINKEIPAKIISENESAIAFLDIKPVNPGHSLIVPKKHYSTIEEISEGELCAVILMLKEIGGKIKDKLGYKGYNVSLNNDPVAGQEIPHLHFHLIPRTSDDGLKLWPQSEYKGSKADEILAKLTN